MNNVRRPKYFNERDRRLVGDEESRLLAAAQAEDHRRCVELELDALVDRVVNADSEYAHLSASQKKRRRLRTRQEFAAQVSGSPLSADFPGEFFDEQTVFAASME